MSTPRVRRTPHAARRNIRTLAVRRTLAGALVCATAMTTAAHQAAADPLGDAKAQAASLQAEVSTLQVQAEQASEKYDAASAALIDLISQENTARRQANSAQAVLDANRATVAERARALYTSGGALTAYASVLGGADPNRMLAALHDMQAISDADRRLLTKTSDASETARQAQAQVNALIERQTDLNRQADDAAEQMRGALARQQQALDAANDQVRTIEAQLQAQIDADAAARAAAMLAAARQAALAGGFVDGPTSPLAHAVITAATTQLGKPYVYGGSGPDVWDCSGLTQWAFRQAGVVLPRTAAQQYAAVPTKVPLGELRPGDLLFWATDMSNPASIHHVAIYLGGDQMLAAPHTGTVVQIEPVYLDGYFGAVRVG